MLCMILQHLYFFFNYTPTTEIYTLSLHDALPILPVIYSVIPDDLGRAFTAFLHRERKFSDSHFYRTHSGSRKTLLWVAKNYPDVEVNLIESRSEEHTSELQSHHDLVCRLLLEKKK